MGKLLEPVVSRLITHFKADLPAALDAIDTEMADGLLLADVVEYHAGERGATDYPACWVLGQEMVPETIEETRFQLDSQMAFGNWTIFIDVDLAIVDPDSPEGLRTRLYRYARGVHAVVRNHQVNDPEWTRARVTRVRLGGVLIPEEGETLFRQGVRLTLEVLRGD